MRREISMPLEPHLYDLLYIDTIKITWVFSSVLIMFLVLIHMMKFHLILLYPSWHVNHRFIQHTHTMYAPYL